MEDEDGDYYLHLLCGNEMKNVVPLVAWRDVLAETGEDLSIKIYF